MDANEISKLIPVRSDGQKSLVNARDLHLFLEIETPFHKWITRMIEYGFEEGKDYVLTYFDRDGNELIIRPDKNVLSDNEILTFYKKEYGLSLNMSKEISMVQRTAQGKLARQYFIDCENELEKIKLHLQLPDFNNPVVAARAWADEVEAKLIAKAQVKAKAEQLKEKTEEIQTKNHQLRIVKEELQLTEPVVKILKSMEGVVDLQTFARETYKIFGIGPNKMYRLLREHKIIRYHFTGSKKENFPYQKYIDAGWFEIDNREGEDQNGKKRMRHIIMVTAKGRICLCKKIMKILRGDDDDHLPGKKSA